MDFIKQNGLDETKPYTVEAQILGEKLRESFEWTEPLIKYWKHDKEAKYYKVRLLTANISMNQADYTKSEDMQFAASNMGWRPLNIDHDHKLRLPFPRNRLEVGQVSEEGNSIEAVIRVDNQDKKIQDMIQAREIVHPSIEAHPICGLALQDGKKIPTCGYYIDEAALLRKEYQLPGDPLSYVYPVPINEALAVSLVESLQTHDHGESLEDLKENITPRGEKIKMTKKEEKIQEQFADLPDGAFACILGEGDSKIRKLPIQDAAHTRNAMARYNQAAGCKTAEVKAKICSAAKKFNVENAFEKGGFCYTGEESVETVEDVQKQLVEKDEKIARLTTKIADLTEENLSLQKDVDNKDSKLTALNKIHLEDETQIAKLEKTNAKHKEREAKHKENLRKSDEENTELKNKVAELEGVIGEQKIDMAEKDRKIESLKQDSVKLNEKYGQSQEQLAVTKRQLNEESSKRAKASQSEINTSKELSEARQEIAVLTEEKATQTRENSDLSDSIAKQSKTILHKDKEIAELKETHREENAIKDKEVDKLNEQLKLEKQLHKNNVEKLTDALNETKAKLKKVKRVGKIIVKA